MKKILLETAATIVLSLTLPGQTGEMGGYWEGAMELHNQATPWPSGLKAPREH
jgi:hypothetical protein